MDLNQRFSVTLFITLICLLTLGTPADYNPKFTITLSRDVSKLVYSANQQYLFATNDKQKMVTIYNGRNYLPMTSLGLDFVADFITVSQTGKVFAVANKNGTNQIYSQTQQTNYGQEKARNQWMGLQQDFVNDEDLENGLKYEMSLEFDINEATDNALPVNIITAMDMNHEGTILAIANSQSLIYFRSKNSTAKINNFIVPLISISSISWSHIQGQTALLISGKDNMTNIIMIYKFNAPLSKFIQSSRTIKYGDFAIYSGNDVLATGRVGDKAIYYLNSHDLSQLKRIDMPKDSYGKVWASTDLRAVAGIKINLTLQQSFEEESHYNKDISNEQGQTNDLFGIFIRRRPFASAEFVTNTTIVQNLYTTVALSPTGDDIITVKNGKQVDIQSACIIGQYYNTLTGTCQICAVKQCAICVSTNTCSLCNVTFYVSNQKCLSCVSPCLTCLGQKQCLTCVSGFELIDQSVCLESTTLAWWIIALIVVGAIVLIGAVGLVVYKRVQANKRRGMEPLAEENYDKI